MARRPSERRRHARPAARGAQIAGAARLPGLEARTARALRKPARIPDRGAVAPARRQDPARGSAAASVRRADLSLRGHHRKAGAGKRVQHADQGAIRHARHLAGSRRRVRAGWQAQAAQRGLPQDLGAVAQGHRGRAAYPHHRGRLRRQVRRRGCVGAVDPEHRVGRAAPPRLGRDRAQRPHDPVADTVGAAGRRDARHLRGRHRPQPNRERAARAQRGARGGRQSEIRFHQACLL